MKLLLVLPSKNSHVSIYEKVAYPKGSLINVRNPQHVVHGMVLPNIFWVLTTTKSRNNDSINDIPTDHNQSDQKKTFVFIYFSLQVVAPLLVAHSNKTNGFTETLDDDDDFLKKANQKCGQDPRQKRLKEILLWKDFQLPQIIKRKKFYRCIFSIIGLKKVGRT